MNRTLDALIAEHVFGLEVICHTYDTHPPYINYTVKTPDDIPSYFVPYYSSQIGEAWLVVEKMRENNYAFCLASVKNIPEVGDWSWIAKYEWHHKGEYKFEFETSIYSPLAICLAALKALGVEVPNE